jgi:hypothetical protein
MKRIHPTEKPLRASADPRRSTPWHAVSVIAGARCCQAARLLQGTRFLSADAPRLPLSQCTMGASCVCAYKHHEDRRGQPRRRDDVMGLRRRGYTTNERRADFGRREDD